MEQREQKEQKLELRFEVYAKIQKPVGEVFDAVYDPAKLSRYFTTGGASGPLEAGTTVMWDFADFPGAFPVQVKKTVKDMRLVFEWDAADGSGKNSVDIRFEAIDPDSTKVCIGESGWNEDPKGLHASYMNCMGWSQMLCCLKAYLEYGINLRKGCY